MNSVQRGVLILAATQMENSHLEFEGELLAPLSESDWKRYRGFGEVVFNTGMTGYQEILTDPSYAGQMVVMTYPHIGNTGINSLDSESREIQCSGLIVHELSQDSPHWQKLASLRETLQNKSVPILTGVDTRLLTRRLRSTGVTRGIICPIEDRESAIQFLKSPPILHADEADWLTQVSQEKSDFSALIEPRFRVVALDFGIKTGLLTELRSRGCSVTLLPANSQLEDILFHRPDGVFLSNGPGNPSKAVQATQTVRSLLGRIPIFGVCMGHQVLAQALGGRTYKLKFGHRGCNQPVLDTRSGRVEISSHNHGYSVDSSSLPSTVRITHSHLQDQSVEGLRWDPIQDPTRPKASAFSVQYHPEARPGPHDSAYCFEEFIADMESWRKMRDTSVATTKKKPRADLSREVLL